MSAATHGVAAAAGGLFAVGLAVAGMTDPAAVRGFLDLADWRPALAAVMIGAIGAHLVPLHVALRSGRPLLAARFHLPTFTDVDARLVIGSALFGMGWAIAGYCPGPALVGLASGRPEAALFAVAMVAGLAAHDLGFGGLRREGSSSGTRFTGTASTRG